MNGDDNQLDPGQADRENAVTQATLAFLLAAFIAVASVVAAFNPRYDVVSLGSVLLVFAPALLAFLFVGVENLRRLKGARSRTSSWLPWTIAVVLGLWWALYLVFVLGSD